MLENRLRKTRKHLSKWARHTGTCTYRLYDRDIPEIPLVLDIYEGSGGDTMELRSYVYGALYERPYEKAESEEAAWLAAMKAAASRALNLPEQNIILKMRGRDRPRGTGRGRQAPLGTGLKLEVAEGDLLFAVDLGGGRDTGLFHDLRLLRRRVREECAGKSVLNLFCYTGAFSVYAARGGARLVQSVDLSMVHLEWARENFWLNGYAAILPDARARAVSLPPTGNHLLPADALKFVDRSRTQKWDIIILDPPVFSNSKRMTGTFDLSRDHIVLLEKCVRLLAPGGKLYFCVRGFHLKPECLPALRMRNITEQVRDEDFKGRRMPEVWQIGTCGP